MTGALDEPESLGRDGHAPDAEPRGLLVEGASEIATLRGGLRRGDAQGDVGLLLPDGDGLALACWEGRILAVGGRNFVHRQIEILGLRPDAFARLDASGCAVTPGLIDAHAHVLFAGSREAEWQLRQRGASYLEILAAGGGILSTVAATRAATDDELLARGRRRLAEMLSHGTTTVETKSGYGLDTPSELRLLDLAARLDVDGPVEVIATFLGAHAVPPELRGRPDATDEYVRRVVEEQLPAVVDQGIATSCDVFCEPAVFDVERSRRILTAARECGLGTRIHADQLEPSGGAELAVELGCRSADHLDAVSEAGIEALARAAASPAPVVATLLPAASWFLGSRRRPPARALIEAGVPVAIATDFNPGTSPVPNLVLTMSIACVELAVTPREALSAATVNAAAALGVADRLGSLEPGKQADLAIWVVPTIDQIPYWAGANLVGAVVKRGRVVASAIGGATR